MSDKNNTNITQNTQRPFIRRADVWIIATIVLICAALLFLFALRPPGAVAVVSIGVGDATVTQKIPLNESGIYHIDGALPVTLQVQDGAIRFINSRCPDHTCEGFGALSREGDWALCAPSEVYVNIVVSH